MPGGSSGPFDMHALLRSPRTRLFVALATTAVIFAAALACSRASSAPVPEDAQTDAAASGRRSDPSIDAELATEPDVLPDPHVAPGECKRLPYTPPAAKTTQYGELCRPSTDQRDLAIVLIHGGSGVGGALEVLRPWTTRLLAEGYVTFNIDYHLFTEGGQSPVYPLPEQNVKAAVQFVRGAGNALGVRKDRVVVQGMSAGARLGAQAYVTPDDPWFGGNELWPDVSDVVNGFIGFYHTYDGSMKYANQYYGGPEPPEPGTPGAPASTTPAMAALRERWDRADSIAHAANAKGPALLISGSRDWDEIDRQMAEFEAALTGAGQSCRVVIIEGGGHGFDQGSATRLSKLGEQAATEVLNWLNEMFPQSPPRPAQSNDPDLANAPNYTGQAPTTYQPRPRTSTRPVAPTTYGSSSSTSTVAATSTSVAPSTTAPATSTHPSTTSAPTTTAPPPTSAPPTGAPVGEP
ncbi:MAG: alpha/beta hydrolase [Acidimicrobiales bacterium]|nr:alpha/beta hydrolase [Acidimicrobiales bacterium]